MEELSFEEAISNLEKIVSELENGKLSLDETIKKYEDGMKLSKKCNDILDNAEKKITILTKDSNGDITITGTFTAITYNYFSYIWAINEI